MTLTNELAELFKLFEAFEALNPKQDSVERKNYVRNLQAQVKSGRLSLSYDQAHRYLASEFELARILVYLMIENTKLNSDLGSRRANALSEWELLNRSAMVALTSRMPLYYAVRTYLTRLRDTPDVRGEARVDRPFFSQMDYALSHSEVDRNSRLRERVAEVIHLLDSTESPTIGESRTRLIGKWLAGIVASVLTAVLSLLFTSNDSPFHKGNDAEHLRWTNNWLQINDSVPFLASSEFRATNRAQWFARIEGIYSNGDS